MPSKKLKILFVPVSSAKGIGEYVRSLNIAETLANHIPELEVGFILSREAPYSQNCPYPVFHTPSSPTQHSAEVIQIISDFKPNIAIFDGAGRVQQYKHCRNLGIKTIFVCQHNKKRDKGLRWRRLRYIDRIWDVQPSFSRKSLSWWSKIKIRILKKPRPVELGPIQPNFTDSFKEKLLEEHRLKEKQYILVNAGGGGQSINGKSAAEAFAEAAVHIVQNTSSNQNTSEKLLIIYGPNFTGSPLNTENQHIIELNHINATAFSALLSGAKASILSGGSSLLQALHHRIPTVAIALAHDQPQRIQACSLIGNVVQSEISPLDIAKSLTNLLHQEEKNYPSMEDPRPLFIQDILDLRTKIEKSDPCKS